MADLNQITLVSTPSLLCNNLNAMNNMMLYCHENEASVIESGTVIAKFAVDQGASTQQAILLEVDDVSMVALASSNGLQIWQIDTQQKLLDWSLSSTSDATSDTFCRALASSPPSTSRASSNVLASCDDNGTIVLCTVSSSNSIDQRHSWEGRGMPCISVAVLGDTLIAGFFDGCIHLYDMVDGSLKLEIQAHSRMLCAMDVHPSQPLFATAAEDATFAVWSLSEDSHKVTLLRSDCWTNTLVTGVAFCGESSDVIAVAGYDCDSIKVFNVT